MAGAVALGKNACVHTFCKPEVSAVKGPTPLPYGDDDQDGLADAAEDALARRFAPIVVLHERDAHRPASIAWLLSRAGDVFEAAPRAVLAGSTKLTGEDGGRALPKTAHAGSADPNDWMTYVHVFPRADGGLNIQYWFFYPYSNGPFLFDHDTDWEHVTVQLDSAGMPLGAELAQHENDHPGRFHPWSELKKDGEHFIVYSALGTHATYADPTDVAWFEETAPCTGLDGCAHPIWKTWEGGGLENLGERRSPRRLDRALAFPDRWGGTGIIPGTSAPRGPLFHRGFCVDGVQGCLDQVGLRTAQLSRPVEAR